MSACLLDKLAQTTSSYCTEVLTLLFVLEQNPGLCWKLIFETFYKNLERINEFIFSKVSDLSFSSIYFSGNFTTDSNVKFTARHFPWSLTKRTLGFEKGVIVFWDNFVLIQKQLFKMFCNLDVLENFARFEKNTSVRASFKIRLQSCSFSVATLPKKETPAQLFSCDLCKILKNTFTLIFTKHLLATTSANRIKIL